MLRVFRVCSMPDFKMSPFADPSFSPDEKVAEDAFKAFWARVLTKEYTLSAADIPILTYGVSCTTFPYDGYETVINSNVFEVIKDTS